MVQNGKQASSRPGSPRKDNACNSDPIPASLCGMGCPHLNFVLTHNSIVDGLIGALAMAFFLRKREKSVWIQLLDTINWPMLEFSPSSRGFVCAGCVHFYNRKHNGFESHFQQTGHCIAVDLKRAETYCHSCGNYVFSTILDQIRYKIKSRIQGNFVCYRRVFVCFL